MMDSSILRVWHSVTSSTRRKITDFDPWNIVSPCTLTATFFQKLFIFFLSNTEYVGSEKSPSPMLVQLYHELGEGVNSFLSLYYYY